MEVVSIVSLMARIHIFLSFKLFIKAAATLMALLSSQGLFAAICEYTVAEEWNSGFKAEMSITNNSSTAISDWEVSWNWSDGSSYNHGWNANFNCSGSSCTVTGAPHTQNIGANQTINFGFIGNKGTNNRPAEASIEINGDICESVSTTTPQMTNTSPAASALIPILSLLLQDDTTPATTTPENLEVLWKLDGAKSDIKYVSTKNSHTSEVNFFTQGTDGSNSLDGSIDRAGNAVLSIDLNDLETGVGTRNERMLNFVFETELLPTAYITVALDTDSLASMNIGDTELQSLSGTLTLHAVSQDIMAEVLVTKTSATDLVVSTIKPILVDSNDFDFASGIEVLKGIANLSSIGHVVPVYFRLHYTENTDESALAVAVPTRPDNPTNFNGSYSEMTTSATLGWQDNSGNESGFIIRRKTDTGLWSTVANLLSNISSYSEELPSEGEFDYKVIAVNDSVPSDSSNIERVVVTNTGDSIAVGLQIYETQCVACHGSSGEGIGSFPAINTPRDLQGLIDYIAENMPFGNSDACGQQCANDVSAYIETLWEDNSGGGVIGACSPDAIHYGARQLKILTRSEYQNSVEDLLGIDYSVADGLSEDDKVGLFANNTHTSIVSSSYGNYLLVAEEIAKWSAERDFAPALSCSAFNQSCADEFISQLAPRIFRRPLNLDELQTYTRMADGSLTSNDIKEGITLALETMLSAPQFLYRSELGEPNPSNSDLDADAFELTSDEMATFLAYTFTGSTPDQELLTAAENDLLRTESEILTQARRLTEATEAKEVMGDFVGSWLGTQDLEVATKDLSVWPGFSELVPHMKNEIRENFASVMLDRNESFGSLYSSGFSYLNAPLAQHYGLSGITGDQMRRVETTDRGGILANGAFMARWGEAVETSPILRSVRVRRRMLCQDELPDPPAGTFEAREAKLAELSDLLQDPDTTNRLKYHLITDDQACSSCHSEYINPLGFGMEDFNTVGNPRLSDLNGNVVDANGQLFAPNDYSNTAEVESFSGTLGLGQLMATLPSAQSCISEQMFRYITGVGHETIDDSNPEGPKLAEEESVGYGCEIGNLTQSMTDSSPRTMLERFSTLDAVRYRKAWSRD